jgi:hypothetical protein
MYSCAKVFGGRKSLLAREILFLRRISQNQNYYYCDTKSTNPQYGKRYNLLKLLALNYWLLIYLSPYFLKVEEKDESRKSRPW